MIDHISFAVNDFAKSLAFYDQTLALLGYERLMTFEHDGHHHAGYGKDGKPAFWMGVDKNPRQDEQVGAARGVHVAFLTDSPEAIQRWHAKCLELGGIDNGAPGTRPQYHPGYYGAFIVDPNGWRIEAVMHTYQANVD